MLKKSKVYGSLAQRIVAVLLVLIVIPLAIDALLLIRGDQKIKHRAADNQLALIGKSFTLYYDQWVAFRLEQLEDPRDLEGLSTRFVFDTSFTCIESNVKEMVGKGGFFTDELKEAFDRGKWLFMGNNVYTGKSELFVVERDKERLRGLSVDEEQFLDPLERYAPFLLTLSDAKTSSKEMKSRFFPAPDAAFSLKVAIPIAKIEELDTGGLYRHLIEFSLVIFVVGGLGTYWLIRKMAKPLKQLSSAMESARNQEYSRRYHRQPFGFEINELGSHFNEMIEAILLHMEEAKNQRVAKELLKKELEIGHQIQRELLPKEIPEFPGVAMASRFVSAKEVAGDFFDLFAVDEDRLFFVIADGSDKGISACLYSFLVRSMLRSFASSEKELSEIIKKTNNLFCQDTGDTGNFVTAWMGILEAPTSTLTYASCGHYPAVWIQSDGAVGELTTRGIALGVQHIEQVDVASVRLLDGDSLFLYTDGVIDAQNEKGQLFGKSRLIELLKAKAELKPQPIVDALMGEIEAFSGGAEAYDDLTVLSLRKT